MARYNLAPTKTNLQKLRDELKFSQLGYDLLDQKRNILVIELLNIVDQTADYQIRVEEQLKTAYRALEEAVLEMGKLRVLHLSSAVNIDTDIRIGSRKVMGVRLPLVDTDFKERAPYYSPVGTSHWVDFSLQAFKSALRHMGKLAELKISVIRLASEVKKTIRKVNALEKIAIPDLKEAVYFIQYRLEENERDMFVLMKLVKERLEKRRNAARGLPNKENTRVR